MLEQSGTHVYIFDLKPRKKRVGLFKGELWLDTKTFMPIREEGEFVKTPSVFLKKVEFVRDYELQDGVAIPKQIISKVDTRIVSSALTKLARSSSQPAISASTLAIFCSNSVQRSRICFSLIGLTRLAVLRRAE